MHEVTARVADDSPYALATAGSDATAVEWVDHGRLEETVVRPHVPRRVHAAIAALLD